MQPGTSLKADPSQLNALENECGLVSRVASTIIRHTGPDALDLLHRLTTKELLSVGVGQAQRTVLTSAQGRVVDTFLVAHVGDNELLLISDSTEPERTISAIDYYTIIEDADLDDLSKTQMRFSLVGPSSRMVIREAFGIEVAGGATVIAEHNRYSAAIAADDSRGVEWVDLVVDRTNSDEIRSKLVSAGATDVDEAHFEHFRVASAIPGSDAEYGEHSNPIEAGLLSLIDFDKGCYVGQEVIARLDAYDKVQRNVRVLRSSEPIAVGTKLQSGTKPAGVVTSSSQVETDKGEFLSLALVRKARLETGTELDAGATTAVVN